MGSHGIKDRVAIIGMGCTHFARALGQEHRRPPRRCGAGHVRLGRLGEGRHRRLLVRHGAVGHVGRAARRGPQARGEARHARRELLRDGLRGAASGVLRRRVGCLRHRHGHRRREGEGLRLPGPQRLPDPERRDQPHPHRGGHVQPRAAGVRREVRRRPHRAAPDRGQDRVEEPPQRRAQPSGAVPARDGHRRHLPRCRRWPVSSR